MSDLLDAVRTGNISSQFGAFGSGQVARDGLRVDTPLGTLDTRQSPIHKFMRAMDEGGGYMRPTQFVIDLNLESIDFDEKKVRPTPKSSSPLSAASSFLQDAISSIPGMSIGKFQSMRLNCHTAQLPMETFTVSDTQKIDGRVRRHPVARAYANESSFTFYVSRDAFERAILLEWHEKIINHKKHAIEYFDNYVKDIHVKVFSNDSATTSTSLLGEVEEKVAHEVILENAWPATINEMDLSYSSRSEVMNMSVTFYFDRAIWAKQRDKEDEPRENDFTGGFGGLL